MRELPAALAISFPKAWELALACDIITGLPMCIRKGPVATTAHFSCGPVCRSELAGERQNPNPKFPKIPIKPQLTSTKPATILNPQSGTRTPQFFRFFGYLGWVHKSIEG